MINLLYNTGVLYNRFFCMWCSTNKMENGILKEVKKKAFETLDDAIEQARKMNSNGQQIHKVIAYKCPLCHKYHVGRSKKELTDKDRKHCRDVKIKLDILKK